MNYPEDKISYNIKQVKEEIYIYMYVMFSQIKMIIFTYYQASPQMTDV